MERRSNASSSHLTPNCCHFFSSSQATDCATENNMSVPGGNRCVFIVVFSSFNRCSFAGREHDDEHASVTSGHGHIVFSSFNRCSFALILLTPFKIENRVIKTAIF